MLTPRKYQQQGIEFLQKHKRAIIADAPGLGKTLQAATAARESGATVVICPTYLVEQWADALRCEYPDDFVAVASGDPMKRDKAIKSFDSAEARESPARWLITNTEALRTYYLPDAEAVIFDEMHYLRNREAQMSKMAFQYAKRIPRIYGLTATPIYKDVGDLWHLLHILDPKTWTAYHKFVDQFANTMNNGWGDRIISTKNKFLLDFWLKKYMLGRTYKDVRMELPDLIEKDVRIEEDKAFYKKYETAKDSWRIELNSPGADGYDFIPLTSASAVIQALRQMTLTPKKIQAIKDLVADVPDHQPVVIFCWYRASAEAIAKEYGVVPIHGDLKPTERARIAKEQRIRVATLASLSEGVDFSDSRTIIMVEESYVPGQLYQAVSRVRRHSHDHSPVVLYSVRVKKTIDDVVHSAVKSRISSAHRILKEALE